MHLSPPPLQWSTVDVDKPHVYVETDPGGLSKWMSCVSLLLIVTRVMNFHNCLWCFIALTVPFR